VHIIDFRLVYYVREIAAEFGKEGRNSRRIREEIARQKAEKAENAAEFGKCGRNSRRIREEIARQKAQK